MYSIDFMINLLMKKKM